ncbi:hypothetical protein OR263_35120 [Streptomyces sp. NEAU-H22]|nr:hypothetical protein [Streptomyces sp. FXY-T5]MCX3291875.1 hypothetical protein [Streptomyces sp. NEAU-H22]WMD06912.1 hypothetical protein Q7C01_22155 [Streptomyces sp. FXY-T5]
MYANFHCWLPAFWSALLDDGRVIAGPSSEAVSALPLLTFTIL